MENQIEHWLKKRNFFVAIVCLFFLSLSVDLINIDIGYFRLKLSHVFGIILLILLVSVNKVIVCEKRFYYSAVLIVSSMLAAAVFSDLFFRSLTYSSVYLFMFLAYFLVPINVMYFLDENKMLKLYIASFFFMGAYAALQFFSSIFGVVLPFSVQTLVFVRGSAITHEPSFYALYAMAFVMFLNAKCLFQQANSKLNLKSADGNSKWPQSFALERNFNIGASSDSSFRLKKKELLEGGLFLKVIFANLFLLVSTATSAFISYIVFFFILFFFKKFTSIESCFYGVRKKILQLFFGFVAFFALGAVIFSDLFRETFLKFFFYGTSPDSFAVRFRGIISCLDAFLERPFFGLGLGGVAPWLHQRLYGGTSEHFDRKILDELEPTNVLSEVLASLGLYGFIGFSFFVIGLWRYFRKILDDQRLLQEERINILSLLISIIVILICLQINQGLFRCYVWAHIGVSVGYVMKIKSKLARR